MELRQYANVLLKWWWLLALSVAIAGGSSYAASRATPPTYLSRTTLIVGQALENPNPTYTEFYTGQVLAQTYADLARREPVLQGVVEALGLKWDWTTLQDMVASRAIPSSSLIEISVTDTDPQRARVLADEIARQLILQTPAATDPQKENERQFIMSQLQDIKANIQKAQQDVRQEDERISQATSARQIQEARSRQTALQQQISNWQATYAQLTLSMQQRAINFLSVVEPAQPAYRVGPRTGYNVMLAAVIGLVLAVGAIFLLEYLDDTIKTPDDVHQTLGLATLGGIARIEGTDYPAKLIAAHHPRSPIAEAYRVLRTNLQFSTVDQPTRTLMVTSPNPVEGKSVTAANLAAVMAQSGKRTILVDADLRRPVQHHIFELINAEGLTTLLLDGKIDPASALKPTSVEHLQVLLSGPLPPNPAELIGSKRMGELIEALAHQADVVIFDSPPVLAVSDAPTLATRVDSTLLVIDAGNTRRGLAQRAKEALTAVGAHVLGVALNRLSARSSGYYHYYYYYAEGERHRRRHSRQNPLEQLLRRTFSRNGPDKAAQPNPEKQTETTA